MSGDFDVFDEWGNFVGKFTPSGGGFEGLFMIMALIFLWVFGFVIYLVVKLIIQLIRKGSRAVSERKWGLAIACFGILIAPLLLFMGTILGSLGVRASSLVLADKITNQVVDKISVVSVKVVTKEPTFWSTGWSIFMITLKNGSDYPVRIDAISDYPLVVSDLGFYSGCYAYSIYGPEEVPSGQFSQFEYHRFQNQEGILLMSGEESVYSCNFREEYHYIYGDTLWIGVAVYSKDLETPMGVQFIKVNSGR